MSKLLRGIPIRLKLAFTYALQLMIVLLAFSLVIRISLNRNLTRQIDNTLQVLAIQSEQYIDPDTMSFNPKITTINLDPDYNMYLLSAQGEVLDSYFSGQIFTPKLGSTESYFTVDHPTLEDEWRTYQYPLMGTDDWFQVVYRTDIYDSALSALDAGLVTAIFLVGIGSIVPAVFFTAYVLRPLKKISDKISTISTRNLTERLNYVGAQDEIGTLAHAFDTMLDRLEQAIRKEQQFIDNAAHELRTPLTAIKGHVGFALERIRNVEDYQSILREVDQQISRMIKLSNDLLFLSRMKHADIQSQFERFDFVPYLSATIHQFSSAMKAKDLHFSHETPESIVLYGDVDLLIRMMTNLIDNAIKYTPIGGKIFLQVLALPATTRFIISNSGPGIEQEKLNMLFERFFRVAPDTHDQSGIIEGTGLGLAIVKEIVDLHGGNIMVSSKQNHETIFDVSFG